MKKKFSLEAEVRSANIVVSIIEESEDNKQGIGYITLKTEDADLLPKIKEMIDGLNSKYRPEAPQTKTGGVNKASGIATVRFEE